MLADAIQPARIENVVAEELKISERRLTAHAATERCHRKMVKTHLKSNPPSRYRIG